MPDSKVRISSSLYTELKRVAEQSGKSMRELAEEAIRAYILGKAGVDGKEIKGITAKIIPLQYPAKCRRCGRELKPGELAYWVRITFTDNTMRSYVYCLDCYFQGSALKEQYIKKRQLEKIIKELRKEANELADKVIELRKEASFYNLGLEIRKLIREVYEALDYTMNPEVQDRLTKLLQVLNKLESFISELEEIENEYNIKNMRKNKKKKGVRQLNYNNYF